MPCPPPTAAGGRRPAAPAARGGVLRTHSRAVCVAASASEQPGWMQVYLKATDLFANLFPLWTIIAAWWGVKSPATFDFLTTDMFTGALAVLMFSMGITMTVDDFKRVLTKPGLVLVNFAACYVMMPLLGLALGKAFMLSPGLVAGMVLVGSINGGQASNLCTYIARGDVALSVIMTTSTTLGCIFMTPIVAKLLIGSVVPVDAVGVAFSAIQVVLAPIFLGVTLNKFCPRLCRAVEPLCPVLGITATVLLVGASVAQCTDALLGAGLYLQLPVMLLHLVGGIGGYWMARAVGGDETSSRTTAIETSMKSSAFGFLLACLHFGDYMARVPAAASVVWMALIGSTLAVVWRFIPVKDDGSAPAAGASA